MCVCLNRCGIRCLFRFTALTLVLEVIRRSTFFGVFRMVNSTTFYQRQVTVIVFCFYFSDKTDSCCVLLQQIQSSVNRMNGRNKLTDAKLKKDEISYLGSKYLFVAGLL